MRKVNTDLEIGGKLIAKGGGDPLEFYSTDGGKTSISTDGSLYIDPNGTIRLNTTSTAHRVTWSTGDSQVFTMPFNVVRIEIRVGISPKLTFSQYQLIGADQIEILDPLEDGDEILFDIEHFITEANNPYPTYAQAEQLNKNYYQSIKEIVDSISEGSGGKIYDTVAEAESLVEKPSDGSLFTVSPITDSENAGHYSFQSSEPNGVRFERPFIEAEFQQFKQDSKTQMLPPGQEFVNIDRPDLVKELGNIVFVDENLNIIPGQEKGDKNEFVKAPDIDRPDLKKVTVNEQNEIINEDLEGIMNDPSNFLINDSKNIDRPDINFAITDKYGNIIYNGVDKNPINPDPEPQPQENTIDYISRFYEPPLMDSFNIANNHSWLLDYDEHIAKWDDLMADNPTNPELDPYITKEEIGISGVGNHAIYRYNFTPPNFKHRVMLFSGTHAAEKMYIKVAYEFMNLLVTDWMNDPVLEYLRWNVDFTILPARSPNSMSWGKSPDGSRTTAETEPIPISWTKSGTEVTITFEVADFPETHLDGSDYFNENFGLEGKIGVGIITTSDASALPIDLHIIKTVVDGTTVIVDAPDNLGSVSGTGTMQVWADLNRNFDYNFENFKPASSVLGDSDGNAYSLYEGKGTRPFSTAENQALKSITDVEDFTLMMDMHAPAKDHYLDYYIGVQKEGFEQAAANMKKYSGNFIMSSFERFESHAPFRPDAPSYYNSNNKPYYLIEWGSGFKSATGQQVSDAMRWMVVVISELIKLDKN